MRRIAEPVKPLEKCTEHRQRALERQPHRKICCFLGEQTIVSLV
jgi:hypothetical protein